MIYVIVLPDGTRKEIKSASYDAAKLKAVEGTGISPDKVKVVGVK